MPQTRFRLYDDAALDAVIDAMARQIAARLDDTPLTLVGVLRRGAPLADRLLARLRVLRPAWSIDRTDLEVKRYGDDLTLLHADTRLSATPEQQRANFSGRRLVVVDDVLYQGHSAARVLEFLRDHQADRVYLAMLVDRCCATLPLRADFVGLKLQIAPLDVIECNVPPFEDEFAVDLLRLG
ncbi:phosphoribosyltransferase family protein [Xanthomonadaceae bacterium JHOS43]|nr:phosphoribosyltransferase family protein [Xanthomonadaceae bacterium JHOS43]MCX7562400.1 phosphoribosyltransferase family protein [Xanthomonadaceae bacterium XH05]